MQQDEWNFLLTIWVRLPPQMVSKKLHSSPPPKAAQEGGRRVELGCAGFALKKVSLQSETSETHAKPM